MIVAKCSGEALASPTSTLKGRGYMLCCHPERSEGSRWWEVRRRLPRPSAEGLAMTGEI